jgi:hypothetical protein
VSLTRYRCTACGNLTRFDVTTTRTTRAFNHFSVGGELQIEEEQVLAESVDEVLCRWCGHGRDVEVLVESTGEEQEEDQAGFSDLTADTEPRSSVL